MPTTIHLDRELLRGVYQGQLPAEVLSSLGLRHLLEVCPHCRQEVEAFQREIAGRLLPAGELIHVLNSVLKRHVSSLKQQHRAAVRDLEALLALPREERFAKVKRSRRRFRGLHLVQFLLEKCEECFTTSPIEARHLAELARAVIQYSAIHAEAFDYLALTVAHLANACRAGGHLREADEHFEHVHYLIRQYAITEPAMLARIADFEGSLRKDQRRFSEAEALLRRALTLYRPSGNSHDIARVMLNLGDLFYVQGLPSKAMEATEEALLYLRSEPDSRLYLMGRYNLTLALVETGQPEQAAEMLNADQDLYRQFPGPWTQLRLYCVLAKISAGVGSLDRALELFEEARVGFISQGIGFDAAIVSLEMAMLYLRQGRSREIRELAEAMAAIFGAQDVHREAFAALILFQDAARAEKVTDVLLIELRAYFRAARHDPEYRFRSSGD